MKGCRDFFPFPSIRKYKEKGFFESEVAVAQARCEKLQVGVTSEASLCIQYNVRDFVFASYLAIPLMELTR